MAQRFFDYADETVNAALSGHVVRRANSPNSLATVRSDAGAPGGKRVELSAGGGGVAVWVPDELANGSMVEQQVFTLFRVPDEPPTGVVTNYAASFCRTSDTADDRYAVDFLQLGDGTRRIRIVRSGNAFSVVATEDFAWQVDTVYAVLIEAVGTTLRVKRWAPADLDDPAVDEPGPWTLTGTNSDLASGELGIGMREQGAELSSVLAMGYGTDGDPAPMSAVGDTFDPVGLTVDTLTISGEAHLEWDPSETPWVEDYSVFRRTPPTGEPFDPQIDTPVASGLTEAAYTDDTADGGTAYDWQVFGRGDAT